VLGLLIVAAGLFVLLRGRPLGPTFGLTWGLALPVAGVALLATQRVARLRQYEAHALLVSVAVVASMMATVLLVDVGRLFR
jgi:hypothetical protein